MKTYLTNCILTFEGAEQAFLNLNVPLEAGEDLCRVFFQGISDTLHPADGKDGATLVKVSMCADIPAGETAESMEANPALSWFNEGNGKIYFNE